MTFHGLPVAIQCFSESVRSDCAVRLEGAHAARAGQVDFGGEAVHGDGDAAVALDVHGAVAARNGHGAALGVHDGAGALQRGQGAVPGDDPGGGLVDHHAAAAVAALGGAAALILRKKKR